MLSDLITIYIFDDDEFSGEIVVDNPTYTITRRPKSGISEMKVKIDEEKILNEINKKLLLLIKNEAVSV
jgi:hypothetical protein